MPIATPESYGNADGVEALEIQKQDSQGSHSVLEISRKQRDSHIPTAPTVCYRISAEQPRPKNWVRWKSGNPKAGFPLSHRTESLRRKEENLKVYTMRPVRCVYYAPVLTHTRVNAWPAADKTCSQECEHGTQECVRHVALPITP
jgi:hypothetical protein